VGSEGGPYPLVTRDHESREVFKGESTIADHRVSGLRKGRMPKFDTLTREVASCERHYHLSIG
jgi:hypothetical protein